MAYLQLLLLFLVAPTALLLAVHGSARVERTLSAIGITALLGLICWVPWDHFLISQGIWDYGVDRVRGTTWAIPWEQYAFFVLQVAFTGSLAVVVLRRFSWKR
jgi:lycopene cyclase domain-containing protein